jgi:hypothetical protein
MRGRISAVFQPSGQIRLAVTSLRPSLQETTEKKSAERSDLTKTSKCKKRIIGISPGFGGLPRRTAFGKRSADSVRERAAAIEKRYTRDMCRFLTGTIPGSASFTPELIARYSGWITQHTNQWLRDHVPGLDYVYVWELQKRGVLHVHYLVAHTNVATLQRLSTNFKNFWVQLLMRLSEISGSDVFERADGSSWRDAPQVVQVLVLTVNKSVANYLAKYLSKSSRDAISESQLCPSRWWGSSRGSESLRIFYSRVVHGVSGPLSKLRGRVAKALGSYSDAVGAVFSFTDRWRPFREISIVYTSGSLDAEALFSGLCAKLFDSASHALDAVPRSRAALFLYSTFLFKGTGYQELGA